jgi:hypothetical protein
MTDQTTVNLQTGTDRLAAIREDISARLYLITEAMPRVTFDALVDQIALVQHRSEQGQFPPPRVVEERLGPVNRRTTPSRTNAVTQPRSVPAITAKVTFDPDTRRLVGSVAVGRGSYWTGLVTMLGEAGDVGSLLLTRHRLTASEDERWEITVPIAELQAMAALLTALAADPAASRLQAEAP